MGKFVNEIICGDVSDVLRRLPSDFVDCVVTSPPYWSLRDYGIEPQVWGGEPGCQHNFNLKEIKTGQVHWNSGGKVIPYGERKIRNGTKRELGFCFKCGAWRGSLGLEPNFDLFIQHLCDIFDEVKRVLKNEGTCWVNLGDTYSGTGTGQKDTGKHGYTPETMARNRPPMDIGYPDKSLCLIPFRFAVEMVKRGWILRNVVIWHKPNCMPSSVKDRFTVDFEYVFFFVKNKKYWFETQYENQKTKPPIMKRGKGKNSILRYNPNGRNKREVWNIDEDRLTYLTSKLYEIKTRLRNKRLKSYEGKSAGQKGWNEALNNAKAYREGLKILQQQEILSVDEIEYFKDYVQNHFGNPEGRTKRTVWTITTKPFKEAHFAVFPPRLVENPIMAGCPEFVCKKCGKARKKILNITTTYLPYKHPAGKQPGKIFSVNAPRWESKTNFIGYTDCGCDAGFNPGIVLDPFSGSGTTLAVAKSLGRNYIGIDLNPEYIKMAQRRIAKLNEDKKSETKR